jgi:hypothetical protein
VRYLLLAVWIVLSAGAASADWNDVMNVLERAGGGTRYDIGADPAEPGWVATRKARFENERARTRGANLRSGILSDAIACRAPNSGDSVSRCE